MGIVAPSLETRVYHDEWMDDQSADEHQVRRALHELTAVNALLGGYRTLRRRLWPFLKARRGSRIDILDLGTGTGDYPARMVKWGAHVGTEVHVTGLDVNARAVASAAAYLDDALPASLRNHVRLMEGDVWALPFATESFDVVTASLFLHHFDDADAVSVLKEMDRIAAAGIVINDLHRHRLSYMGIRIIAKLLPVSAMFANDGPLSVRRAFRPSELRRLGQAAGLERFDVRRTWAFRLSLSTV